MTLDLRLLLQRNVFSAYQNPANWAGKNTVLSHGIEVEVWLFMTRKRKEDAVALTCKCWAPNTLDFIKYRSLI